MSSSIYHALVWCEIPVTNLDAAAKFYGAVYNTKLEPTDFGGGMMVFLPMENPEQVSGHVYEGKPAAKGTGSTVHLAAPDSMEATVKRAVDAGGEIVGDPVTIPTGKFQYLNDPDGNSISIFEFNS